MRERPAGISKGALRGLIFAYISIIAVVVASILYTQSVDRQSNQKWCEVLVPLDDAYSTSPPTTELGQKVARAMHDLRINFGCH